MRRKATTALTIWMSVIAGMGCVKRAEVDALKASNRALEARLVQLERNPTRPGLAPGAPIPAGAAELAPGELQAKPAARPNTPDGNTVYSVPLGVSPIDGPNDAKVTVVMFSDYQCPFCGLAESTMQKLGQDYGKKIRFVLKHNPLGFHPRAMPASMAVACAGAQKKFWPMHRKLMADQSHLDDKDLEATAKNVGVNVPTYRKCIAQAEPKAAIVADQALAAALGARGTPAFFINGRFLSGNQRPEKFKELIDAELARVDASKTKAVDYYARVVVAEGKKSL